MRNLKKLLAVFIAVAMMVTVMVPSFAAVDPGSVSEGIEDESVKAAVEKLVALGIVSGKEDGKYHPEENITRDAFVKMVVEALGMGTPAQAPTQFSDVPADRWSSGYVNAAVGAGLVKGRADGTFGPMDNVTMAEAATILVRALGYQDSFLTGSWPSNYMAAAAQTGITKGVRAGASDALTRGTVAVLLNNAFDANIVERDQYGTENTWKENEDETLLYDRLGIVKLEEVDVTGTPKVSNLDEDQIKINQTKTYDDGEPARDYEEYETFDVAYEFADVNSLLGMNVNLYIDEDTDDVVYIEPSGKEYKVIYDVIDAGEDVEEDSITLVNADTEYDFDEEYKVYLDNELVAEDDSDDDNRDQIREDNRSGKTLEDYVLDGGDENPIYGRFVFNDKGSIVLADLMQFDGDLAMIVTAVDEDAQEITYNMTDADDEDKITFDDYDRYVIYDNQGNTMELGDVKKDDIVYLNDEDLDGDELKEGTNSDEVAYLVVVRNTVEGAITSYDESEVEIDDKSYDWSVHPTDGATESINDDKDYALVSSDDGIDDLDDASDEEINVVALMDLCGDVRHLRGSADSSSDDMYSIITGVDIRYGDAYIKVLNQENDEVEYFVDADFDEGDGTVGYRDVDDIAEGDFIKYSLNSDGDIDSIAFLGRLNLDDGTVATKATDIGVDDKELEIDAASDDDLYVHTGTVTDDFGEDSMQIDPDDGNQDDFVVADRIQCLDVTAAGDPGNYDLGDAEFVDYANLADKSESDAKVLYVLDDNDSVLFVAFLADFDGSNDEQAGYALERRTKDGDPLVEIVLPTGETVTYIVDENYIDDLLPGGEDALKDETVIAFEVKQNGKIDVLKPVQDDDKGESEDYKTVTGVVYDIDGKSIQIADKDGDVIGGRYYKRASDCTVWMTDGEETFSSLKEGESLVTVAIKNGLIEVIKIYDVEDGTKDTDSEFVKFRKYYEADNGESISSFDDLYNDLNKKYPTRTDGKGEYTID